MKPYPASDHISGKEWLALAALLLIPLGMLALCFYLLYRAING